MKNTLFILVLICLPIYSLNIPGFYKCSEIRISRTRGDKVFKKGFMTPSLYLKFETGSLTLSGKHSDYNLSEKFTITKTTRDTMIAEMKLEDRDEQVLIVSKGDTLILDFTVHSDDLPIRTNVLLLLKPVEKQSKKHRRSSKSQSDVNKPEALKRDLLGR